MINVVPNVGKIGAKIETGHNFSALRLKKLVVVAVCMIFHGQHDEAIRILLSWPKTSVISYLI